MPASRLRWTVPVGAAAVVAGTVLMPSLASAGTPALPVLHPAELLAAAGSARVAGLSGTVTSTSALGLPSLSELGASSSGLTGLATGTHTLRVWLAGQDEQRVSVDDSLAEYDVVRRGTTAWTYDSSSDTVTKVTLPAEPASAAPERAGTPATPAQAAAEVLAAVGPTTAVTVDDNLYVAGRPAYDLVLTPKDSRSLVGSVHLALDGATKVPLQVQVFARGAAKPAVSVGFSSVTFRVPSAGVFAVPTGKAVKSVTPPAGRAHPREVARPATSVIGSGWTAVVAAKDVPLGGSAGLLGQVGSAVNVAGVHGHLVRSALVTALVLDDGRVYAGAVTPEVLTALAAAR